MATRKKTKKRAKPHYVRTRKRKGADSSALARRATTIALLLLVVIGILFGITQGFKWISRKLFSENPRFEMQHLVVSSDGRLTEDRIREYIELAEGTNLFAVSFADIDKKLSGVSDIESVRLERKLPHTLIVEVKERMPVARITGLNNKYPFLLDRYGYVLPPRPGAASLPLIKGLDTELRLGSQTGHPDVKTALEIIALCDSRGYLRTYARIESMDVKYSDFIDMRLAGEIRIRMPRYSLKSKLQYLDTLLKIERGKGRPVKEVDLTVDSTKVKVPISHY
ncbi:MAG: FtsQ-type POTRA domain-containing protein [Verrucomicrobia bacterium]|nr:FtsQ-type POTRA domain-containing protein [Verrucomicrobiota bacterium]